MELLIHGFSQSVYNSPYRPLLLSARAQFVASATFEVANAPGVRWLPLWELLFEMFISILAFSLGIISLVSHKIHIF